MTKAQAEKIAAQRSPDDLTDQERQELDRLQAELDDYVLNERLALARAGQVSKRRRSPARSSCKPPASCPATR